MHVKLLQYLTLKAPLTTTISMYYMIYQNDTYTDIYDIKFNQFRGNNPEHDTTKNMLTPD